MCGNIENLKQIMGTTINRFVWQTCIISTNKQLINVVTQSSYKCGELLLRTLFINTPLL